MLVKIVDASGVPGGRAIALCDENGEIWGRQTRAVVENDADGIPTVTVTFPIDGDRIRFAG